MRGNSLTGALAALLLSCALLLNGCGVPAAEHAVTPEDIEHTAEPVPEPTLAPTTAPTVLPTPCPAVEPPEAVYAQPLAAEERQPVQPQTAPAVGRARKRAIEPYSEENLDKVVQSVLDKIITPGTSKLQQARAVFDYAHDKIIYVGASDKSDWKQGAYEGITTLKGDCYTYYAVSRALLTALDIDNLEVKRVGGVTQHFWNLVNCGEGWYHFDSCPHLISDHFSSFMLTDQEVADFTAVKGRNYYVFDETNLPARGPAAAAPETTEVPVEDPPIPTGEPETAPVQEEVPSAEENPAPSQEVIQTEEGAEPGGAEPTPETGGETEGAPAPTEPADREDEPVVLE